MCRQFCLLLCLVDLLIFIKKKKRFFALNLSCSGCSYVSSLFTNEEQKKVGSRYILYLATHSGLVHDITDADCWAQNGSTHGNVLQLSNVDFFTDRSRNGVEKICVLAQ